VTIPRHEDAAALLRCLAPDVPVTCLRPEIARAAAERFVARFPGDTFYAVKANPDSRILGALHAGGVNAFDVASIAEIRLVRRLLPDAELAFMHPVKSRSAIREAWDLGVRTFALDHPGELAKLREEVAEPAALRLIVRLDVPDGDSGVRLASKFGARGDAAAELLLRCRQAARFVGASFHVGSQATRPGAWQSALACADAVIRTAGVLVDVVDVGGGFPVSYPGRPARALEGWFHEIETAFDKMAVAHGCQLWAEPGRILCAGASSLLARVELRKAASLHINDGTYGGLFDAGPLVDFRYPARLVRPSTAPYRPFELFGPTCDGLDRMRGPFWLPADVAEGDWIELGQLGAYSHTLRTGFNGFGQALTAILDDEPPRVASSAHRQQSH